MSDQFGPSPMHRANDQETSIAAAHRVSLHITRDRLLCLTALAGMVDATDYDLADATGRQQNSIGKRRLECQRAGFVEATGAKRDGPTGTPCLVWRITEAGRAFLQQEADHGR